MMLTTIAITAPMSCQLGGAIFNSGSAALLLCCFAILCVVYFMIFSVVWKTFSHKVTSVLVGCSSE
jgi:hypothetical protein